MLGRAIRGLAVAACALALAACGGDDTPGSRVIATPTPTPTPTTSVIDFDLRAGFEAESENTAISVSNFRPAADGIRRFDTATRVDGVTAVSLRYSPARLTLAFPDLSSPVQFASTAFGTTSDTRLVVGRTDFGAVLDIPFDHVLRASYTSEENASRNGAAGIVETRRTAFFFNPVTTQSDLAETITYAGDTSVSGGVPGDTRLSTQRLSARTVNLQLRPGGRPSDDDRIAATISISESQGITTPRSVSIPFDTAISANGSFAQEIDHRGYTGTVYGSVAGPDRQEVLILFAVSGEDLGQTVIYVGNFIGSR
ncbi:hypothetical protein D6201_12055 [Aurantiacibacter aquimixticola]|uniref:Transferrin-binding protein B C-lobe/N-lobe beta barrel domain-containing protein n=2 Tax=Aurantiacibacter aquimixticola TaxID=1958945 RepID=A0A419RW16_9SPHN|nr:hypothetical protein D6201_12055 [Aurantiacibacter aquimixticola]